MMKIPFLDLTRQYDTIKQEIDDTVLRVVQSGRYIGGLEVEKFEQEMAEYLGVRHAIGVSSGTDALLASLMALGVGPDDEVITTPFSFIATAEVVSFLGARPVFVDIDDKTYNINPAFIESKITTRTRAIIPVHLFGQMAQMDQIMKIATKHGLHVIEDAAQAVGAKYKKQGACTFGDAGCLSFFPSKNLGCFGDGGMVCTNDDEIATKIRQIREHGSSRRYHHIMVGFNGRLDALQAAVLRVKLRRLGEWTEKRRANASFYTENLKDVVNVPWVDERCYHVFNQYSFCVERRDELIEYLGNRGIPTAVYYPIPLHLQEVFRDRGNMKGDFPIAERISKRIISIPVFPELKEEEKEYIVKEIKSFTANR